MSWEVVEGDCLDVMRGMDAESVDAIVTDPPYGLGFMGKEWDHGVPGAPFWRAALRVAKPGAHLLAFGGTRTFHRLTCAIEDAGWEIRDCIMWVYGSGFPKSLDISKAIDKTADYRLQAVVRRAAVEAVEVAGLSLPGNSRWDWTVGEHAPGNKWWAEFQAWIPELSDDQRDRVEREIVARVQKAAGWFTSRDIYNVTVPATEAAREWDGWGTALKPAWEPIIVAMKPLDGTFAENAQRHGVAGLNIDGCRVAGTKPDTIRGAGGQHGITSPRNGQGRILDDGKGRWPANLIHDGSEEVVGLFPQTGRSSDRPRRNGDFASVAKGREAAHITRGHNDVGGSAARFFYTAKASRAERNNGGDVAIDNRHPTVKPVSLLKYLCKLVSIPTGGVILDPFCGSGTTGVGAMDNGQDFVGIEKDAEDCEIARKRITAAVAQGELFTRVTNL